VYAIQSRTSVGDIFNDSKQTFAMETWVNSKGQILIQVNLARVWNNYRLVSSLFHEFHHAYWIVSGTYDYNICELGLKKAHALNEIEAYEFSWNLGAYIDQTAINVYNRHIDTLFSYE